MDTRYAFKRKEDHKKRVYQNTSNLNENNYRKRYGRKRKHSRATEAMDGGRGYLFPLGVWCQHADVHLPYVGGEVPLKEIEKALGKMIGKFKVKSL